MQNKWKKTLLCLIAVIVFISGCVRENDKAGETDSTRKIHNTKEINISDIGLEDSKSDDKDIYTYQDKPYIVINDNEPSFLKKEITNKGFESYSELDELNRCGVAVACVGIDTMPTEKRGDISEIKPSGWHSVSYDFVEGKSLYNRCHLIGFQLTGENANEKNLITGTRYMNVDGMLPFENMIADYVKETKNHVMYRVTPVYKGLEVVARGVEMEAYSVEDDGEGIAFHVFCHNVQPGVKINYKTGESRAVDADKKESSEKNNDSEDTDESKENYTQSLSDRKCDYILNMNTHKFHLPGCRSVEQMSEANKGYYNGNRSELIDEGYEPCKNCNP